ncbi:InlB B-repeat-containing protein [Lachnospiraceae bacterium 29-84]
MSKKWMVRGISCYLFFMAWYVWGLIQADAAEPGITVTVTQEGYVQVGIDSRELGDGEISVICYEPGWNQDPGDWSGNQAYLTYVNQYTLKDGKASFGFPVKGEKKDGEYALVVGTGSGTFVQAFPQQEEEVRYTVTYVAGKGGKIKGTAVQKVEAGGTGEEVTAVPDTGYRFLAWDDGILNASRRETEVGKDQTHTALFQKIEAEEYKVTFHPNGGEAATKERMVKKGDPVGALPKATRTGYRLLGWFTAKEGGKQITSATRVSSPMAVYAQWIRLAPAKGTKFSHGDLKYQIVKAASSVKHTGTVSVLGAKTKKKHVSIPAKVD